MGDPEASKFHEMFNTRPVGPPNEFDCEFDLITGANFGPIDGGDDGLETSEIASSSNQF